MSLASTRPSRAVGFAAIAALVASAVLLVRAWPIDYPYSIDFQTYWLAGSRLLHGEAAKLYTPGGGTADRLPAQMAANEFKNLPIVAMAFAPLAVLDYLVAKRVFWWLSLLALSGTAWIAGRHLVPAALGPPAARGLSAFALLAVMAPAHIALRHGQTTPFIALLVAAFLALTSLSRPAPAGGVLAAACAVKFPPLALLALDAARARWRAVAACVLALAVVFVASLVLFGPGLNRAYVDGVLAQRGTVTPGHNNQSLVAAATRVEGPTPLNDWQPVRASAAASWTSRVVGLLLAVAVGFGLRGRRDLALESTAGLALGIVVLPIAWDHYFLLLGPGLIASAGALAARREHALLAGLGVAFVLLAVPTPSSLLDRHATTGVLDGLLVSHYLLGAVVALVVAVTALRRS